MLGAMCPAPDPTEPRVHAEGIVHMYLALEPAVRVNVRLEELILAGPTSPWKV